ncbi:MAG: hypothetical protein II882_03250 [Lachnospiraceae bacterium]|nr:hypothetical protein [Lachnospiraceae bacterium]
MKNTMRKLFAMLLVLVTAASLLNVPQVQAAGKTEFVCEDLPADRGTLREQKIKALVQELAEEEGVKITACTLRTLKDFAGSEYTLIECEPTGYFILHEESGSFTEYAPECDSPYKGLRGDLYYAGPSWYFGKNGSDYKHTIENTMTSLAKEEDQLALEEYCVALKNSLMSGKNEEIAAYLKDDGTAVGAVRLFGREETDGSSALSKKNGTRAVNEDPSGSSVVYAYGYCFFTKLKTQSQIGYTDYMVACGKGCGYVATNLLLRYWHNRGRIQIPLSYINSPVNLTNYLVAIAYELGHNSMSAGADIMAKIIRRFCTDYGISPTYVKTKLWINQAQPEICNKRRPCIIGGKLHTSNESFWHAMVAYGYQQKTNCYVMHMTWSNYAHVFINASSISQWYYDPVTHVAGYVPGVVLFYP